MAGTKKAAKPKAVRASTKAATPGARARAGAKVSTGAVHAVRPATRGDGIDVATPVPIARTRKAK